MTLRAAMLLFVSVWLIGCAAPVARDQLESADDLTLLKQMQWLNRTPPDSFDFGDGGREAYIDSVREQIIARHGEWLPRTVDLIRRSQIEVGMTKTQVVTSVGWPNEYPSVLWDSYFGEHRTFGDPLDQMQARSRANKWTYGKWDEARHLFFHWDSGVLFRIIDNRPELGDERPKVYELAELEHSLKRAAPVRQRSSR